MMLTQERYKEICGMIDAYLLWHPSRRADFYYTLSQAIFPEDLDDDERREIDSIVRETGLTVRELSYFGEEVQGRLEDDLYREAAEDLQGTIEDGWGDDD
jgi:hypothetical protein